MERLISIYENAYSKEVTLNKYLCARIKKDFFKKVDKLYYSINRKKYRTIDKEHMMLAKYLMVCSDEREKYASKLKSMVELLAKKDAGFLKTIKDADLFMDYLEKKNDVVVKGITIKEKYKRYSAESLKQQILEQVQTNPVVEFIDTRKMTRNFHLHIGPTNSGKTYESIEKLTTAKNGVYLSPLRLLALEIYDTLTEKGVSCNMITGEEQIYTPGYTVTSQTIETVILDKKYDVAVIDEAQMLAEEYRGHFWVRAIMGIQADDIYVCGSADAEKILIDIIKKCGDNYDVTHHERKTPLLMDDIFFNIKNNRLNKISKPGDAYIVFSKRSALDMAARLELEGIKASIIYGKLPPEIRRNEVKKFQNNETSVVVATDAIGMGINLPIQRIVFMQTEKFDGEQMRSLTATEVKQIAGRAGRYGVYEKGYVTALDKSSFRFIEKMISSELEEIEYARLAFPEILLDLTYDIPSILTAWKKIPAIFPYKKMGIENMLKLYAVLKQETYQFSLLPSGEDKNLIYKMISCPMDEGNLNVLSLWVYYCKNYTAKKSLVFPELSMSGGKNRLELLETYYKLLDLYRNLSSILGKVIDEDRLSMERMNTDAEIMSILSKNKNGYMSKCNICGKILPINYKYRMCNHCYGVY